MNIPIIANSFAGIAEALYSMGFELGQVIPWNRSPMRIDGVWHAEVRHG